MIYIGIDLSLTSTGICVLKDKTYEANIIKTKLKGCARLIYIKDKIEDILLSHFHGRDMLIAIEGYSYGSVGKMADIGELGGVVKTMIFDNNFKTIVIPPTSLKKFITGKGNSPKDIMISKTLKKYNVEFENNNKCDAFGLAQMAKAYEEGTKIQYEKDALKGVDLLK